ncbi:hypothetical protein CCA_00613 [Chlamydia caviae GPIC]|uniref:Uncharacterized protein n=1 Tax=Chlamydia caviae (strain ATCC VR-813 / DSM 19441 / 03DC25 / GPIC) TaxID=227941 RepID=Q822R6_CHLCV|nr:hypothetical protein CCA_00613 [Chlamydia caviae GPIC]
MMKKQESSIRRAQKIKKFYKNTTCAIILPRFSFPAPLTKKI